MTNAREHALRGDVIAELCIEEARKYASKLGLDISKRVQEIEIELKE
ncbi:MAG: hypothetical protein QXD72_02450 [Candidatus Aenigmatarchaeota archaeon]